MSLQYRCKECSRKVALEDGVVRFTPQRFMDPKNFGGRIVILNPLVLCAPCNEMPRMVRAFVNIWMGVTQ